MVSIFKWAAVAVLGELPRHGDGALAVCGKAGTRTKATLPCVHAIDLAMLAAAGFGVAFHAKPAVRAAAAQRIECGDLTGLLFLQGFEVSDFAQ
mgnify:CR=1 FL=1